MGYEYMIYCEKHKDAFIISKIGGYFLQKMDPSPFTLDMMPKDYPKYHELYERQIELIKAFYNRHPKCKMQIASDKNAGEWPWIENYGPEIYRKIIIGEKGRLENGWTIFYIYGDIEFIKLVYTRQDVVKKELEKGKKDLKILFLEEIFPEDC